MERTETRIDRTLVERRRAQAAGPCRASRGSLALRRPSGIARPDARRRYLGDPRNELGRSSMASPPGNARADDVDAALRRGGDEAGRRGASTIPQARRVTGSPCARVVAASALLVVSAVCGPGVYCRPPCCSCFPRQASGRRPRTLWRFEMVVSSPGELRGRRRALAREDARTDVAFGPNRPPARRPTPLSSGEPKKAMQTNERTSRAERARDDPKDGTWWKRARVSGAEARLVSGDPHLAAASAGRGFGQSNRALTDARQFARTAGRVGSHRSASYDLHGLRDKALSEARIP